MTITAWGRKGLFGLHLYVKNPSLEKSGQELKQELKQQPGRRVAGGLLPSLLFWISQAHLHSNDTTHKEQALLQQ